MFTHGTGHKPPVYVQSMRLAKYVAEFYISNKLRDQPTFSRSNIDPYDEGYGDRMYPDIEKEIAHEICMSENIRKPLASIPNVVNHLSLRYQRMGEKGIEEERAAFNRRKIEQRHPKTCADEMRERLAQYFARDGATRGRGEFDALYQQEKALMRQRKGRQVRGIYHTYFNPYGTEKPRLPGKREARAAEKTRREPAFSFDAP